MGTFERPVLLLDDLIYPKSLIEIIKDQIKVKKFAPEFFGGDYIRLIVISSDDEDKLDETSRQIQSIFYNYIKNVGVLIIDNEEVITQLKEIEKQINNEIPEKNYYDWFITLAFQCRQMTVPLNGYGEEKRQYNPSSTIITLKHENEIYSNYIFFSSNGSLLNNIVINELIKKARKKINILIDKDFKPKIKKKNKRDPIESRLRHEVFKKDNYKCLECGKTNKETTLHVDHIVPVSQGGSDELDNLQTLCQACNLAKSNRKWEGGKNE